MSFPLSLYLHIPFCFSKCDYCDFYSAPPDGEYAKPYIDALLRETKRRLLELTERHDVYVPSVYIGGGTPSLLGAEGITRLLDGLAFILPLKAAEITVEANPESTSGAFLAACAAHGVTRLSLGIQSFDAAVRKAAGRRTDIIPDVLAAAAEVFGTGLSVDLITGLPLQTVDGLCSGIEKALSFRPGHVSLYALTVEDGTPLAARLSAKTASSAGLPSVDQADRLWLAGRDMLIRWGYEQYEVSNFAFQTSGRCLHNIRYWRMENWIGIGPSASGTIIESGGSGRRISYVPDTEAFLSGAGKAEGTFILTEELNRETVLRETLLMGFRYTEGTDPVLFERRFGQTVETAIPRTLAKWPDTEKRMLFLNAFLRDAFTELDEKRLYRRYFMFAR